MKKKALAAVVISVALLAVASIGIVLYLKLWQAPSETHTVRIGALLALTGSAANYGRSLRNGIEIAKDEINAQGGINGKPLEVIYEDSQGDAKTGLSGFSKLINVDRVPVVIGSISSVILAVAPVADRNQVVLINSSAISPKIAERATDFLFSIMVSGAQEAQFFASYYVKTHPRDPIAVLYSNNSSGIDTKDALIRDLTAAGVKVAIIEGYELNMTDFRTTLAKIRESGARYGYMIPFSSEECARVLNQSQEMRLGIQWYTYSFFETREILALASSAAEGVIYSYPDYSAQKDRMEAFQRRYKEKSGSWADIYTVTSYDGVTLLAQIMRSYGTSSKEIQRGLREGGTFIGVFGLLKFEKKQYVRKPLLWKTVRNGEYYLLNTFRRP